MKTVKQPTYTNDLEGDIARWDERDIVFARKDLFRYFGEDTEQFKGYYQMHPEHFAFDQKISRRKPLGSDNPMDAPMFAAQFDFLDELGLEKMVDGEPAEVKEVLNPGAAASKVRAAARMYGADLVKIGPLNQQWTYSHAGCTMGNRVGYPFWGEPIDLSHHMHAIGMGFRMDLHLLASAPFFPDPGCHRAGLCHQRLGSGPPRALYPPNGLFSQGAPFQ